MRGSAASYDRRVRWLVALGLVAVTAASAHAKPVLRERDVFDRLAPVPCAKGKTWPLVMRCLTKAYKAQKATAAVVFDKTTLKVVTATFADDVRELVVYTQVDAADWHRTSLTVRANRLSDIVRIEAFQTPQGESVRIDAGMSVRTSFLIAPGSVVRGVVRRRTSHVCFPGSLSCRSLVTTCEAYAHGKVYWLFHGEPVWHPTLGLRMRGNGSLGGSVCAPLSSLLVDDDA